MKQIATFGIGAVLAAAVVFLAMRGDKPAEVPKTVATSAVVQAPSPIVEPVASPVPEPARIAPEPARVPNRKPSVIAARPTTVTRHPNHGGEPSRQAPAPAVQTPVAVPPAVVQPSPAPVMETKRLDPPPPVREPKTATIPAGTLVSVRIDERLSSETHKAGDTFRATLDQPLVVDGFVLAERGARAEGRIVESDAGGRVRGLSRLSLELVRLNTSDGQRVKVATQSFAKEGEQNRKKDAVKVGAAAGIGAAIGAIAGGGKGAAIGAAAGGAAGAGGVMATRGSAAEVVPETRVSFKLSEAVTVTEKLR